MDFNPATATSPNWRTASVASGSDTLTRELSALGQHLNVCKQSSGRLFNVRIGAEAMHGFLAARFVTTLFIIAVVIAVSTFVF